MLTGADEVYCRHRQDPAQCLSCKLDWIQNELKWVDSILEEIYREEESQQLRKDAAYRRRKIQDGLCPHCGKPCTPYYECEDRRQNKNMNRVLNRLVRLGIISKQIYPGRKTLYQAMSQVPWPSKRSQGYHLKEGDRRKWPRIGKKIFRDDQIMFLMKSVLREAREPLQADALYEGVLGKVTELKKGRNQVEMWCLK